jgi:hypothetical protein
LYLPTAAPCIGDLHSGKGRSFVIFVSEIIRHKRPVPHYQIYGQAYVEKTHILEESGVGSRVQPPHKNVTTVATVEMTPEEYVHPATPFAKKHTPFRVNSPPREAIDEESGSNKCCYARRK